MTKGTKATSLSFLGIVDYAWLVWEEDIACELAFRMHNILRRWIQGLYAYWGSSWMNEAG
jgi:hypothetical protein